MTTPERKVVDVLQSLRDKEGMNDIVFARYIHLSQSYWSRLLSGERGIGKDAAQKIYRRYPQLQRLLEDCFVPINMLNDISA